MSLITEDDFKLKLDEPMSLGRDDLMAVLGQGLRTLYKPVLEEGVPVQLERLVRTLGSSLTARAGASSAPASSAPDERA